MALDKEQKIFKYHRDCKLPSCKKPFGTNRSWQYFCPKTEDKNCQQKWQQLLRKKHEDVIVEMEILKEEIAKLKFTLNTLIEITKDFKPSIKINQYIEKK